MKLNHEDHEEHKEFTVKTLNSVGHKNLLILIFKLRLVSGKYGRYITSIDKYKRVYGTLIGVTSYNK